jgi:hypothetical protein
VDGNSQLPSREGEDAGHVQFYAQSRGSVRITLSLTNLLYSLSSMFDRQTESTLNIIWYESAVRTIPLGYRHRRYQHGDMTRAPVPSYLSSRRYLSSCRHDMKATGSWPCPLYLSSCRFPIAICSMASAALGVDLI